MIKNAFLLEEIVKATEGQVIHANQNSFKGISTDSREKNDGAVFIALKGENFDAHDYLEQAIENGAKALIVHKNEKSLKYESVTVIKVKDTLKALQDLGNFWRKKQNAQVIAITGTNGKTTTKEFVSQILAEKFSVCASKGSLNNHWGVPLSLLHLQSQNRFMISEMGMNHPGEIARLCAIAEPDICLVTNVGRGHLEGMGSVEGVAKEKQQIYQASPQAKKVFNLDNSYTRNMWQMYRKEKNDYTFSLKEPMADVYFSKVESVDTFLQIEGLIGGVEGSAKVEVFGRQNASNLAAAATLALAAGMEGNEIWQALPKCKTIWGRNQWVSLACDAKVLFDAYNANPESMKVFLENAAAVKVSGKKIFILGDMRELGSMNDEEHLALAETLTKMDVDNIYFIGKNAALMASSLKSKNIINSDTYKQNLAIELKNMLQPQDRLFMKASRGVELEKFLLDLDPLDFSAKK